MFLSAFFKGSWLVQLIVGIGLFACSFFLEYRVLRSFFSPQPLALLLAVTLECDKISAIIWHYYLHHLSEHDYPVPVRLTSLFFRLGLVFLSLLCSMLFLSARLDRPGLEKVRAAELAAVEQRHKDRLAEAERLHLDRKKTAHAGQMQERRVVEEQWNRRIEQLESLLLDEMNNTVRGAFRGPRYVELEQRLAKEKAGQQQALKEFDLGSASRAADMENAFREEQKKIEQETEQERQVVQERDYTTDKRANDPHIIAFLQVVESLWQQTLLPLQFVFFFSILISVLLEAGIMLAFSTLTIAVVPVFMAHHQVAVEKETLKAQVNGEAERDDLLHGAAVNRVRRAGERVVKEAEARLKNAVA
ncbi:MAG: hypothetical protein D3903_08250 [Candidatus Electrothrix sp. GM3_4]|nr:hypothetical protein [Candidatus Electrothrix sp. GM3_4]